MTLKIDAGLNEFTDLLEGYEKFEVIRIDTSLPIRYQGETLLEGKSYVVKKPLQLIIAVKYLPKPVEIEIALRN